ncbi:MAG: hypothetical protein KDD37_04665 [Bdellovibrionales bacterium]|nr:hypothetical protein [Bdellovibrionales bacterium]
MKYYVFLLSVVLIMSFQNCSNPSDKAFASKKLIETAGLDGSTDTGNGGLNYTASEFTIDMGEFKTILCAKNEEFTETPQFDCLSEISADVSFYNSLSSEIVFNSVPEFIQFSNAEMLLFDSVTTPECLNYITNFIPEADYNGIGVVNRILEFSSCQHIIIPSPIYDDYFP